MSSVLKKTPFHDRVAALNDVNAWERWQGYTTASVLYSEPEEYFAIRAGASLYDVSPILKYRVTGADAARVVDRIMTRDIGRVKVGRAAYSPWCDGRGRLIEEGTVFRLGENDFRINCAEHQLAWFRDAAWGFDASIEDESETLAGLSLQGPLSRAVLEDIGLADAGRLPWFGLGTFPFDGGEVLVSRTGFTGDLGFELWVAPERAEALWDRLWATRETRYLKAIGARALNTARIEAGFVLINVDYVAANRAVRQSQTRTPSQLGLDWAVHLDKPHFTGRRALLAERARGGPTRRLVGLDIPGKKVATGAYLYAGRKEAGQVTSACWSPITKKNIALAFVDARHAAPGTKLMADIYYVKEVTQGRAPTTGRVVDHHFYQPAHRKG